jgi:hypothetical protein
MKVIFLCLIRKKSYVVEGGLRSLDMSRSSRYAKWHRPGARAICLTKRCFAFKNTKAHEEQGAQRYGNVIYLRISN